MAEIVLADLTTATVDGTGVFDVLMRATKVHLDEEYSKNRIKGPEYATVYLGSLTQVMNQSLQFLLTSQKTDLELQLMEAQIRAADAQVLLVQAQTELAIQEKLNAENQWLLLAEQKAKMVAETALLGQQLTNLQANLPQIEAQTAMIVQQRLNTITEEVVLQKQICKLAAEFDLLMEQKLKTATETTLLAQKVNTEKAQTTSLGVDADSVVGRQKQLYGAQADGYRRDAEQKAAKLMVDSWNTRRMTDEGTVADGLNKLSDGYVGQAIRQLLEGVDAYVHLG